MRWTSTTLLRAGALRQAGLSYPAVAAVLSLDTGEDNSEEQVRYYLQTYGGVLRDPPRAPTSGLRCGRVS